MLDYDYVSHYVMYLMKKYQHSFRNSILIHSVQSSHPYYVHPMKYAQG